MRYEALILTSFILKIKYKINRDVAIYNTKLIIIVLTKSKL